MEKVRDEMIKMSQDESERYLYLREQMAIRDKASQLRSAENIGIRKGELLKLVTLVQRKIEKGVGPGGGGVLLDLIGQGQAVPDAVDALGVQLDHLGVPVDLHELRLHAQLLAHGGGKLGVKPGKVTVGVGVVHGLVDGVANDHLALALDLVQVALCCGGAAGRGRRCRSGSGSGCGTATGGKTQSGHAETGGHQKAATRNAFHIQVPPSMFHRAVLRRLPLIYRFAVLKR